MKMIQIRHVPDDVHRELKERAARAGMSLSDFLRKELEALVALPPPGDVVARIRNGPLLAPDESAADAVRAERNDR